MGNAMKPSASASGLYGRRWRKLRALHLLRNPLCVMCKEDGIIRLATELDHIVKHDGNLDLFYAWDNLQGLCATHHRSYKARLERGKKTTACDIKGNPLGALKHCQ